MTTNKKIVQLGMYTSRAANKLNRSIMYHLAKKLNEHYCYRCGAEICTIKEFTVEHKTPWLDSPNPVELYFDLENIAFSHFLCNSRAGRKLGGNHKKKETKDLKHGNSYAYCKRKCRCEVCVAWKTKWNKISRDKKKSNEITRP